MSETVSRNVSERQHMGKSRVATFGELMITLSPRGFDRFVQADDFVVRYTGAESNVAVSLACFGVGTDVVSKVPANDIGQACVNYHRRFGVNTDFIARGGDRLGLIYMEAGVSQRPSVVIYDRANSAFSECDRSDFDWDAILTGKEWFHVSGTAPALGPNVNDALLDGLKKAKELGVTVSMDCNYRSKLWSVEEAGKKLRELMEYVDVFVGGWQDVKYILGLDVDIDGVDDIERSKRASEAVIKRYGMKMAAMTVREAPSASLNYYTGLLTTPEGTEVSKRYEIQVAERIGGGDAFTAGLIYGVLNGFDTAKTIAFAVAASCLKHSVAGDFNLASVEEVEELAFGSGSARIKR